tara:strand:+ start:742 stop:1860 length:1119 start_codon:yes stop_codon:yes gene_type:complete
LNSNKKITLIISSLSGGGAESVCVNVANSFANNDWQVDLVVLNLQNEVYLNRLSDKVNLVVLNVNHARYSAIPLLKYIYTKKIKTVLVFNYELAVILVILRLILKLKIKIISRNINTLSIKIKQFDQQNFWTRYVVKTLVKYFYDKTDYVVNQCNTMQNDLITYFPNLYQNSITIYNPVPMHILDYAKNDDLNQTKKENYLLCVGRLEKQKAFHFAIEAFAGVANKFPHLRLKIVGKGSLEKDLRQIAFDYHIADKVDFEGFQKDIIPYYLNAKGTLLTSIYEGYPNVLIESIAMNTPVVSFDCPGGPNEIIKNGVNGFLAKYLDVDDLKKKISLLLQNKFDYENLKTSIEKNQIKEVFKQYENLINSFIKI